MTTVQTQIRLLALSVHLGHWNRWNLNPLAHCTPLYGLMLSRYRRGAGAGSMLDQSG